MRQSGYRYHCHLDDGRRIPFFVRKYQRDPSYQLVFITPTDLQISPERPTTVLTGASSKDEAITAGHRLIKQYYALQAAVKKLPHVSIWIELVDGSFEMMTRNAGREFVKLDYEVELAGQIHRESECSDSGRPLLTYFIEGVGTDLIKIGKTIDLPNRLRSLQCGSAVPLNVLSTTETPERHFHNYLSAYRVRGEWFRRNTALSKMLSHLAAEGQLPDNSEWERRFPCV